MHYYKKNLGDYAKKAGRLTILQHGAYNLLIDCCYDRETFPTLEQAIEWVWASSTEEIEAVNFVLKRFFIEGEDGIFTQNRIIEEIANYQRNVETNTRIANERETKRKQKGTKRERSVNEAPPNHKPLTTNHKPLTNKQKKKPLAIRPSNVSPQVWDDFITIRKAKRSPLTVTALNGIINQAIKAGISINDALVTCCERGWMSFKAEWLDKKFMAGAMTDEDAMKNSGAAQWLAEEKANGRAG